MQKRLGQLGFAMPLEPIPNFKSDDPSASESYGALCGIDDGAFGGILQKTASSHTTGQSTHASGRAGTISSSPFARRPMKRQRLDSPLPKNAQIKHSSDRHAMPPPAKPLSRMQSMRSMFPSLKKKFSTDQSSAMIREGLEDGRNVQTIEEDGRCQTAKSLRQQVRDVLHGEPPYMSGALPVEKTPEISDPRSPQCVAQVSTEPSYIHLLDALSNDNGVKLELKDPRKSSRSGYQGDNMKGQVVHADENQPGFQCEERWGLGHDAFHQAPNKSFVSGGTYQPLPQDRPTDMYANRNHNQPDVGHSTSASERYHLGHPIDTVVSPYFKSGDRQAQSYLPSGPAEPEGSSNHSAIYRSQRPPKSKSQAAWSEPRGLNGLSFFDFPVRPGNKPGKLAQSSREVGPEPAFSPSHHQSRFLDSSGFIRRPETEHPQYWKDEAYMPSQFRTPYTRQLSGYSRTGASPSIQRCSIYNRIGEVLPTVPLVQPPAFPVHSQSQWKKLQRAGVRSSQNAPGDLVRNKLGVPSQQMFPVSGRRNIIR